MTLADNLKNLLQKKNSSSHVDKKRGGDVDVVSKSQVNVNKPQRKSAGRGR